MVKTPEDVFEIIKKECTFDGVLCQDNKNTIIEPLQDCADLAGISWTWDEGISKLVLIFDDLNFVIKIPYTGLVDEEADDHYYDHCACCDIKSSARCENCAYYDDPFGENERGDSDYYDFTGANNGGKTLRREWDYCEAETWLYQHAKEVGLECCFAETRLLGFVDGHPIYMQAKAQIYGDYYSSTRKTHTDKEIVNTKEACKRIDGWCFNVNWLTDFILFYGDDIFQSFMAFIKIYGVRDLHTGNVGYVDGVPVLVDYSGFES